MYWVLGFAFRHFCEGGPFVVLIEKKRPEWQRGRWNGVGGKIEPDDNTPAYAMAREFEEETGVETAPDDWSLVGNVEVKAGPRGRVFVYTTDLGPDQRPQTTTDEKVASFVTSNLPLDVMPTARAFIGLSEISECLDSPVVVSLDSLP